MVQYAEDPPGSLSAAGCDTAHLMEDNLERITEHLHYVEDTCSIYVVRTDRDCLIDCGTDSVRSDWPVDCVLLTHYHRDQCASAAAWQRRGARIFIPFCERRYFEEADLLRASYDVFDNYAMYYPGFTSVEDIKPDGYARDYEPIDWQGLRFDVVPLPGHTFGSVGYRFELDEQKFLAAGDLLKSPRQLWEYYSSQWNYMDFTGHVHLLESLKHVASMEIDVILPGHGQPFPFDAGELNALRAKLERLYEMFYDRPYTYFMPKFRAITPHVFEVTNSSARTYVIKDDEGHAMFVDCGYMDTAPIQRNPHRFIDHLTEHLKPQLNIEQVEWFVCSHYHDDHLAGFPCLRAQYGTKQVAAPELVDILTHPERFDMPCLLPEGVPVDLVVSRDEPFQWRDSVTLFIDQQPGQTLYNQVLRFDAFGRRFMSIGDNISALSFEENRNYIYSFIPKNRAPLSSYGEMPDELLDDWPDFVLTGHGGAIPSDERIEQWRDWMNEWQADWMRLMGQPHPDMGMDPRWIEFCPYKVRVAPNESVTLQVKITNYHDTPSHCALQFRSLDGVTIAPVTTERNIPPRALASVDVTVTVPGSFRTHSLPVVADVTWNGRRLGPIAEAILYW